MDLHKHYLSLSSQYPNTYIKEKEPLAPYTTLKIGGPADLFIHTKTTKDFESILSYISKENIPYTLLGNGSNVLISDSGIEGIVLKNSSQEINILNKIESPVAPNPNPSAHRQESDPNNYLDFAKLDYDESEYPQVKVEISSGTLLPFAINTLLKEGITGLQWYAYIPGTIGGAIWYNLHGGSHHFSEILDTITYFDLKTGKKESSKASSLNWDYDQSEFQDKPNLVILSATFNLYKGDADKAQKVVQAWILQKSKVQPMNSAGSIFQNPPLEPCLKNWGEQKSTGWIIDQELNLKGTRIGDAQIGPQHANIFTNQGQATAKDFYSLIKLVQDKVKQKFNFKLELELKLLGKH